MSATHDLNPVVYIVKWVGFLVLCLAMPLIIYLLIFTAIIQVNNLYMFGNYVQEISIGLVIIIVPAMLIAVIVGFVISQFAPIQRPLSSTRKHALTLIMSLIAILLVFVGFTLIYSPAIPEITQLFIDILSSVLIVSTIPVLWLAVGVFRYLSNLQRWQVSNGIIGKSKRY